MRRRIARQEMKGKRVASLLLIVATAVIASCGRYGTGSGVQASAPNYGTPPGRMNGLMAYDPQLGKLVMFGGGTTTAPLNDTWAWDGKGWINLHPATSPAGPGNSLVYDAATHQLLLFGGDQQAFKIWVWKNGDWAELQAFQLRTCEKTSANGAPNGVACMPPLGGYPEGFGAATFDAAHGRVVMIAGPETWSWDGKAWTRLNTLDPMTAANCYCLSYDSSTQQLLSLAATGGKLKPLVNHTWVLQGASWATVASGSDPYPGLMVDDPAHHTLMLLVTPSTVQSIAPTQGMPTSTQMWSWNGAAWTRLNGTFPDFAQGIAAAYDGANKQVVVFGGIDPYGSAIADTWTWNGRTWTKR